MPGNPLPRSYDEWCVVAVDREEDAAYTFEYRLITHCRDEAISTLSSEASSETKAAVEEAIDTALLNVADMLEGFWRLEAGPNHTVELVMGVRVHDADGKIIEVIEISPAKFDLPIGYWK